MINLDALLSAIQERKARAERAEPFGTDLEIRFGDYGWYVYGAPGGEFLDSAEGKANAEYWATCDPAAVLRQVERDLDLLEIYRNEASESEGRMTRDEICEHHARLSLLEYLATRLAHAYAIPTEDET